MRIPLIAACALALAAVGPAHAQNQPHGGINAGSLSCHVAGGAGFIFGSSKTLDCVFTRADGTAEHYTGSIKKFGVDLGFTKDAHIVWGVFAPGDVAKGALAGDYGGGTAGATIGVGVGANALVGGGSKQVSLQPVSIEGSQGLNVAAGIAILELKAAG